MINLVTFTFRARFWVSFFFCYFYLIMDVLESDKTYLLKLAGF